MTFPPCTPMTFPRILTPRPGFVYDRVTYPNLPQFAETLTFDRYRDDMTQCGPIIHCGPGRAWPCPPSLSRSACSGLGGLGMLTVPVSGLVRAAANGLGGFLGLGETEAERISRQERERIQRAYGNPVGPGGPRTPPAVLPPGTVKTPMQAAGDALANLFGSGPATPPGTTTDNGEDVTTTATPPISSGAPSWGLYVGLGVLVIGGIALAATLMKKPAPAGNRRRGSRRRRRNPTLEQSPANPDTVVVRVNKDELLCDGGKRLPYSTWIGTISRRTGRINVWSPAAYKPRGYRAAAKRMLESLVPSVKGT